MRRRWAAFLASLSLVASSCGVAAEAGGATIPRTVRILFIGNSLTYTNDLPGMVAKIGAAAGVEVVTGMVAFPNFGLEDHLKEGRAVAAMQKEKWDFVVLQQGPSALEESRVNQILNARRFADLIRRNGAEPAMMTVWPSRAGARSFDDVILSARLAARAMRGRLIPAGQSWREAWRRSPSLDLYASDGFHPSPKGSYLAALTTYLALVGPLPPLTSSDAKEQLELDVMRQAAERAQRTPRV